MTIIQFDKENPRDLSQPQKPDNVIPLGGVTSLPIDPDRVLNASISKMDKVFIIGEKKDGEFYFASSEPDGGFILWYMELAKKRLMQDV